MSDCPQSFANHRAMPSTVFLVAFAILVVNVLWAICLLVRAPGIDTTISLSLTIALVLTLAVARRSAQIVQDRVIRLEMHLRLERLLPGQDLAALTLPQVIALRFASDGELPGLVARVLKRELITPNQIKAAITQWQADWLRV